MLSFFIGVVATLVVLVVVGTILTRGLLLATVRFMAIVGINRLMGKNIFS